MRILFQIPSLDTIYAGRTIYAGYKNAFEDLGHEFYPLTALNNLEVVFDKVQPEILMTALNTYNLKFLDLPIIKKQRILGMKVFVNIPYWKSPISKLRINETQSLSKNKAHQDIIRSGNFGDVYYNVCEQGDPRMEGFEETTGYQYSTILLAADKTLHYPEYSEKYKADISYLGTCLPGKKKFFEQNVFPLKDKYSLKIYGQDWSSYDRIKGFIQKVGQYFNIPLVRSIQKPKLDLNDERKIYNSSLISINIHENFQKEFGGECNERTFKIPICGGFEITDDVACIRKYFKESEEIVIAKDTKDWLEKIDYFLRYPEKRIPIMEAGRKKVLNEHTYHNRVNQILDIYRTLHE